MSQFWKPQVLVDRDASAVFGTVPFINRHRHLTLRQQRELLPIARYKTQILYAIEKFSTIVLIGETGCGKSTQLPIYLHEGGWTQKGYNIVCTQPRRIAVSTVATRVSEELGCVLGEEVGYGIRFDFKCSSTTKIRYYTDGILLRETMVDPLLSKYSVVIVDEAHQRSLHSDILLGLLKKIKRKRPELRIIVTSATLDAEALKKFFETNVSADKSKDDCCILSVQGRTHPVDILYLQSPCRNYISEAVATVFKIHSLEDVHGDILVFLPGGEDIDEMVSQLKETFSGDNMFFLPLYASLPNHIQMQVFEPTPPRMRKVVVATNIAEASVTIEGIRYVIDCGFNKLNYFDVKSGIDMLVTCPVSQAAATQRAGRAGRTEPGKCFRLMTKDSFKTLPKYAPAEMQRIDITWAVLQLKALGIDDVLHFDFLSPPPVSSMIYALELLFSLGAVNESGKITHVGAQMAEMPLEPRIAKFLLSSFEFGCSDDMLTIAAMSSVEYPFLTLRSKASLESKTKLEKDIESLSVVGSDHLTMLNIYKQFAESGHSSSWCDEHSLQFRILSRAKEIRGNLTNMIKRFKPDGLALASAMEDDKTIRKCLVTGLFAHAARLHNDGSYRTLRGGLVVQPYHQSVIEKFGAPPEWVIFNEIIHSKAAHIREVTRIEPLWLYDVAKHYYDLKM